MRGVIPSLVGVWLGAVIASALGYEEAFTLAVQATLFVTLGYWHGREHVLASAAERIKGRRAA